MKLSPVTLVLLFSFPVGNDAFLLTLIFKPIIAAICSTITSTINAGSATTGFTCGDCSGKYKLFKITGELTCTGSKTLGASLGTVSGSIKVQIQGNLLPPSGSISSASGCLDANLANLITSSGDSDATDINNAITAGGGLDICVTAVGKPNSLDFQSCDASIKFSGRSFACTCATTCSGNRGFDLNCPGDFGDFILPGAGKALTLPDVPCFGL